MPPPSTPATTRSSTPIRIGSWQRKIVLPLKTIIFGLAGCGPESPKTGSENLAGFGSERLGLSVVKSWKLTWLSNSPKSEFARGNRQFCPEIAAKP